MDEIRKERERYVNFEKAANGIKYTDQDLNKLKNEIDSLKAEEAQTLEQLRAAEKDEASLDEQLRQLELEEEELGKEEEE